MRAQRIPNSQRLYAFGCDSGRAKPPLTSPSKPYAFRSKAIWLFIRLKQTYEAHSGYAFKGTWYAATGLAHVDAACFHDYHHTINRGNFG